MNTELASISIVDYEKKRYNYIGDLHYGLAVVQKTGAFRNGFGFINAKGEEVIPCSYDYAEDFSEGLACVRKDGYFGFINTKGEEVIPCKIYEARSFHEGLALIHNKKGLYGYINTKGKKVISCQYEYAYDFHEGLACVKKNSLYGCINTKGEEVIPYKYSSRSFDFNEGLANVAIRNDIGLVYFGYINAKGEEVIPCQYKFAGGFHDGLALIIDDDGKYAYINKKGEKVISCEYEDAGVFHEGLAYVRNYHGKYGYINEQGKEVIRCQFSNANNFKNGWALVTKNHKNFYIDKQGNLFDQREIEEQIEPQKNLESVNYYSDITINNRKTTLVAETKLNLAKQKQKFLLDFQNEIEQYKNSLQQELEAEQVKTKGQLKI